MDRRAGAAQVPRGRGRVMTQRRTVPARQHRRHPVPITCQCSVPDGVHAAVDGVESTRMEASIDGVLAEAEGDQLATTDHPVLARHERIGVGFPSHTEG